MEPLYLSFFLEENTPLYGGSKNMISFQPISSISNGDNANSLKIEFPNHAGTHLDFPFHFSNEGKKSSDYPASFWIFNKIGFLDCTVEELPEKISSLPADIELLILKSGFGKKRDTEEYWAAQPIIPAYFASMLKTKFSKLRVFGFDMISLTSKLDRAEGKKAHLAFLMENDILILEDLNLDQLFKTPERVVISPLQINEADGAPCTVIAF